MTIVLRDYQQAAVDATMEWCATRSDDPCVILPTGSGKSLVLSAIIAQAQANDPTFRACVLAMQAELVEQNARAAGRLLRPNRVGIYSAGLKRKDTDHSVIVGNIQSIARKPHDLGAFDMLLIDEAHLIADADRGQYRTFVKAARIQNPAVRLVGLTATPWKLSSGLIYEGQGALFGGVAYEASLLEMIDRGYLCRPITKATETQFDVSDVHMRGGEYIQGELERAVDVEDITHAATDEIIRKMGARKRWVIFCVSVAHARHVAESLTARGIVAATVHGELSRDERAYRLAAFDRGEIRALCNCQLLTVGWDCPAVDGIVLMRPTKSAGLYVQQTGRGLRLHPDKQDCLVLDMAGLIQQFGPIDHIVAPKKRAKGEDEEKGEAPVKTCPECDSIVFAGLAICPDCGFEFPPPERPALLPSASTLPILSTEHVEAIWHDVTEVVYAFHEAKAPKITPTLRVEYHAGFRRVASEWVCIEHTGFARSKAEGWWRARSIDACPDTIEDALTLTHALRAPTRIATRPDGKYTRVVDYEWPRVAGDVVKACTTCAFFTEALFVGEAAMCAKWDAEPPADVIAVGCEGWAVGEMQAANARADAALDDESDDLPF